MTTRASLATFFLLIGASCGGTPAPGPEHPTASDGEGTSAGATWTIAPCPSGDAEEVFADDDTRYFLAGRDRLTVDVNGVQHAREIPSDEIVLARQLTSADGVSAWYFVTSGGAILRADEGFLGSLSVVAALPAHVRDELPASGALLIPVGHGAPWLFEPEGGARELGLPAGRAPIQFAVQWPSAIAVLVEPGEVFLSHDGGAHYAALAMDQVVVEVLTGDETIWLRLADESGLALAEDGSTYAIDLPDANESQYEEAEPTGDAPDDEDSWCGPLPLAVTARWSASSPVPIDTEDLDAPARCRATAGRSVVLFQCAPRRHRGDVELRVLDETTGLLRSLGTLEGAGEVWVQDPIDSDGSRTFVVGFDDGDGVRHLSFFDGTSLVPLAQDEGEDARTLRAVHDDVGIAADWSGRIGLVRLPTLEAIELELPEGTPPVTWADFAADGRLMVVSVSASSASFFVGSPGHWTRAALPDGADRIAMADGQRGLLTTSSAVLFTEDGGQTWTPAGIPHGYNGDVRCAREGCVSVGTGTFRAQPAARVRTTVATPHAADASEPTRWRYPRFEWSCTPPAAARGGQTFVSGDPISSGDWGYAWRVESDDHPAMTWVSSDVRGVFHGRAALPPTDGEWWGPALVTRTFAVVTGSEGWAIAAPSPARLDLDDIGMAISSGSAPRGVALPDGGAFLMFEAETAHGHPTQLGVRIDREGHRIANRVYSWSSDYLAERAIAFGPDGVPGPAVSSLVDHHWTVYPVDGSPSIDLDAAVTTGAPCAAPPPWTLVLTNGLIGLRIGDDWTLTSPTTVLGVGPDGACILAVRSTQPYQNTSQPVLYASRGRIRGTAMDESPRGRPLTCTLSVPETTTDSAPSP